MQITTSGVVLRTKSVGDDRLVTILTPDMGLLSAIARGANSPRGRLTSATEQFCYSRLVLFRYRDNVTVDSAETISSFFELRRDLEGLALASYFAQLACELAPHEEPAAEHLRLFLNSLYLIGKRQRPLFQIKAIFELRLLTLSGFMPDLTGCSVCGAYQPESAYFSVEEGVLFCEKCRPPQIVASEIPPGVLAAMRHILYSPFDKLFSFILSDEGMRVLAGFCERYLKCRMQRSYSSLDFYHAVASQNGQTTHTEGTP